MLLWVVVTEQPHQKSVNSERVERESHAAPSEQAAHAGRWRSNSGASFGNLAHSRRENCNGPMPFQRGRRSQYCIEARIACVLGDLLAGGDVIADQISFRHVEDLAHA